MKTSKLSSFSGWKVLRLALVPVAITLGSSAFAQSYVNVTVGGQFAPGVFGQIAVGNNPPPPVFNERPVIIERYVREAPIIYMHVPDYESHDWEHHCAKYRACDKQVHFVRVEENNRWWDQHNQYLRGEDNYWKHEHRRDDHEDARHDNGRGHGWGHGNEDEYRRRED